MRVPSAHDFGELDFGHQAQVASLAPPPAPSAVRAEEPRQAAGGTGFGELDLGGGEEAPSIATEGPRGPSATGDAKSAISANPPAAREVTPEIASASSEVPIAAPVRRKARTSEAPKSTSKGKRFALAFFGLLVIGGAALGFTPYGVFGSTVIMDVIKARDYERAAATAITETQKVLAADTYDGAKNALDALAAAHAKMPRARALTAYAALVESEVILRFGQDASRGSRSKQWLGELPPDTVVKYRDAAVAAQAAVNDDLDKGRKGLDAASKRDTADPAQLDVALTRGAVELAGKDGGGALAAFKRAGEIAGPNDARVHYGAARAYVLLGDLASARKELAATLAASPQHPGALTLRARVDTNPGGEAVALKDLAAVLEGPAKAKVSPVELSDAFAARAWLQLARGAASEARSSFAEAVKLNARNVDALTGEGRLLLDEGRYTEALARLDTALLVDASSALTIAADAEAKLMLERLADAKAQLIAAREKFPKSIEILTILGRIESHLGNNDAAEADLRAAIGVVDPSRRDAVTPYVVLSSLLASRGKITDAQIVLDEAKRKLPDSAALQRAFGEVAEMQGQYDEAVDHYKKALAKEPKDVATHFRLGVALRRMGKFEDAGLELDRVQGIDKDYPGLALERGLLYEESGDVTKAIEQFKSALAKAPDDPDLQLRVGSAYVAIGRPDDALPMLKKVLEKRPNSAEGHHYIGRALMLKGSSEQESLRYLKRAVELDPNRAEFHVYVAWAANDSTPAQLALAKDEVDKALTLDKLSAEAYWQRGVLERKQGAIEDAIKDEKRALELRPSRYEAHAALAECYEDKNDDAAAITEWAKAIGADGPDRTADPGAGHPYWRFRYGKLLWEKARVGAALTNLTIAVAGGEKLDPRPAWVSQAEFLFAESLRKGGKKAEAIEHYRRFLEIAPPTSPDRTDAIHALAGLGAR
jgi:tetratricopeptide (TPR) repeat protein